MIKRGEDLSIVR